MTDERNNSGNRNSGNSNSGDCNSGYGNSGYWNSGNWNSGDCNSGYRNSGNWNSGNRNSGNWNSGNRNSGNWNACDYSSGYFCLETQDTILVFDKPCKREDYLKADKPDFLCFNLTEWIEDDSLQEGGYLKTLKYKEAFQKSYNAASQEDRDKIYNIPNFCPDKFYQLSGIDVRKDTKRDTKIDEIEAEMRRLADELKELKGD